MKPLLIGGVALAAVAITAWALWARRRGRRHLTDRLRGAHVQPLAHAADALPAVVRDLTLMGLGHSHCVTEAYAAPSPGGESLILQYEFESGFGDSRRLHRFVVCCRVRYHAVESLFLTRVAPLAYSAVRPGFDVTRVGDWFAVRATDVQQDRRDLAASLIESIAPKYSCEVRPGLIAVFVAGSLNDALAAEMQAALTHVQHALTEAATLNA